MKYLAIFYTNNIISHTVLKKALDCFNKTVRCSQTFYKTLGVVVSKKSISDELNPGYETLQNLIAPEEIINKGHLSIIEKISLAMEKFPSDYVSLHEHDVLYPKEYLLTIQNIIKELGSTFDYLAYNNIIGVNRTGYQDRIVEDYPLSTLIFTYPALKDLLEHKRTEYLANNGWCFLEPGYGGSYGSHLKKLEIGKGSEDPIVHVNMNDTVTNHHFTNHYLTYEPVSKTGFNEWPGDVAYLFDKK